MPSPSMSEGDLLEAWGAGDERAGEMLFRRHYGAVSRFFRNKAPVDVQEELIQDAFLACLEARERFRREGSFRAYLFTIANRTLCRYYRRRKGGRVSLDTGRLSVRDLAPGPSTITAKRREHRELVEALRAIPLDYQVALELHYWEAMTAARIAGILEIPVGTAKTRLRRGRQLLLEQLDAMHRGETDVSAVSVEIEHWVAELREQLGARDQES